MLTACAIWPIGEDPKGKELRSQATLVVEAIVQYKTKHGALPPSLAALVPEFIRELPEVTNYLFYLPERKSVIYNYSPSWPQLGQTRCATIIGSGKWNCHGYI